MYLSIYIYEYICTYLHMWLAANSAKMWLAQICLIIKLRRKHVNMYVRLLKYFVVMLLELKYICTDEHMYIRTQLCLSACMYGLSKNIVHKLK